ncbi:MAG: glycosyl hydrolase, partial [Candidatus Weimeria sp.]
SKDLSNNCSEEVLPGGKYNDRYTAYLDIIADYAKQLGDIPVLFRPLHECDGGWFWWGSATTDKETYKALYRYTEDYLTSQGVHNFIYVYSPGGPVEEEKYLSRYPGDDYVDVLGFDYYNDYSTYPAEYSDDFFTSLDKSCEVLGKIADEKGKVSAISETGVRVEKSDGSDNEGLLVKGNPIKGKNWYSKVNDIAKKNGQSYFLLWANFSDTNFYVPYKYSDSKGQELINEFIDFYNEDSSVFANGTNFYSSAESKTVSNENTGKAKGYFTNIFSKDAVTAPITLKANVSDASEVQFVLKNGSTEQTITAVKADASDEYSGQITDEVLKALGKTDVGTISLVADEKTLSELSFISFGQEKQKHPKDTIDDFELYFGDSDYMNGTYSENSAAGCSSSFSLNSSEKAAGEYSGSFNYTLKNSSSEVWTGRKMSLPYNDYSEYNALSMWVKPDGKGQKLVIQITSNGEDFEAYLNDFAKTTDAKYVTIPFSSMKGKNGGKVDPSKITNFAIWCNSVADNTDLTSSILFDNIKFGKVDDSSINVTSGGYVLSDVTITGAKPKQLITAKDSNGNVLKFVTNASGKVARKEIVKIGKVKYLAAADGQLASKETVKVGKSYYYADKNGKLVTKDKKIVKTSNGSRYITKKSGKLYTSHWVKIGKKKYKVSKTGKITQVKTVRSGKKK